MFEFVGIRLSYYYLIIGVTMLKEMKSCRENRIKYLNDTKEYTLISSSVLLTLVEDHILSATCFRVWVALYNLSKFTDDLSVTISRKELSTKVRKSVSTISACIKQLKERGYVSVQMHNRANTYSLDIPENIFIELQCRPTRLSSKRSFSSLPSHKLEGSEDDSLYIYNKKNNNNKDSHGSDILRTDTDYSIFYLKKKSVDSVDAITELRDEVINKRLECVEALKSATTAKEMDTLLTEDGTLSAHLQQYENTLEGLSPVIDINPTISGDAPEISLTKQELACIENGVSDHVSGGAKQTIVSGIIYAITKGSLVTQKYNNQPYGILKAINIALKLVREGRWSSPLKYSSVKRSINTIHARVPGIEESMHYQQICHEQVTSRAVGKAAIANILKNI